MIRGVQPWGAVPDRPGWFFGSLTRGSDDGGWFADVTLQSPRCAEGSYRTLAVRVRRADRGRPGPEDIVPEAHRAIDEAVATPTR